MVKYLIPLSSVFVLILFGAEVGWSQFTQANQIEQFNTISRIEIELLLDDIARQNPMAIKRLSQDPGLKAKQLENLRQLLAFASQAQKEGLADEPTNRQELNNIKLEVVALGYDREVNKDKGPKPAFGFITDEQVRRFWGENTEKAAHEAECLSD